MNQALKKWLEGRPPVIHFLAEKYPPGFTFRLDGKTAHVVGYNEDHSVLASFTDPSVDHKKATEERFRICACCLKRYHHL